jgi:hypothetical protein
MFRPVGVTNFLTNFLGFGSIYVLGSQIRPLASRKTEKRHQKKMVGRTLSNKKRFTDFLLKTFNKI